MNKTHNDEEFLFDSFIKPEVNDWDEEIVSGKPKAKLDIFDEMRNADLKNKDFLANLEPDVRNTFSPLVAMRWFSSVPDNSKYRDYVLILVNEMLNVDFWSLKDHPELQWKLMAMCGTGSVLRHNWIPMSKRQKNSKTTQYMLQWYPSANDDEIAIILKSMNRDQFEQFVKSTGASDAELKEVIDNYDKENGFTPEKAPKKQSKKSSKG